MKKSLILECNLLLINLNFLLLKKVGNVFIISKIKFFFMYLPNKLGKRIISTFLNFFSQNFSKTLLFFP